LKLITSKQCIAQGVPSFELVWRRKYSEWAIVTIVGQFKKYAAIIFMASRKNS